MVLNMTHVPGSMWILICWKLWWNSTPSGVKKSHQARMADTLSGFSTNGGSLPGKKAVQ